MTVRNALLIVLLGLPAAGLLVFGPRGKYDVPIGRTVIRYWEKWSGVEGRAMQQIVDDFNNTVGADKGIWVEYCAISSIERRTLIATAGGDPPDVAGLYDYIVPQFADQGALLDLEDLAREHGINEDAFKPIWWQMGMYEGKLYALPSAPYTIALLYNRKLFREAGLDPDRPPRTIAELDEYHYKLVKRDAKGRITQVGFMPAPALLGWWHWVWPYFFNARLWDGQSFHLDTPEGRAAMRWIAERRKKIGVEDALEFEAVSGAVEGAQNPFLSGRLAMVFQGPWIANWVNAYAPDLDYAVAPFPSVNENDHNAFASADVFVIPRGSRHPQEAMTFLAYVERQDVMERLCKAHCKVSPFRHPSPEFFKDHPNPYIRVFDALADSPDVFGPPKMPMFQHASMEMLFMLESVLQGVRGPDEAVKATQAKIDTIVDEYQRMTAKRHGQSLAAE